MKIKIKFAFVVITILIFIFPVFSMPLFSENESAEKRELSQIPVLYSEEDGFNSDYTSELNTYFSEHFSFRSELVTACNFVLAKCFGVSNQDKIVVGSDDWLYFADTLPDYTGSGRLTDEEISSAVKVLELMNEGVKAQGCDFVFVVAPNKNTVYPENMPYYITKTNLPTNYERLNSLLKDSDYYVDVSESFKSDSTQLYHKRDSHWNNIGAEKCFSDIMRRLGKPCRDYSSSGYRIEKSWRGDLDDMIFPKLSYLDEQAVFNYQPQFEYVSNYRTPEDMKIKTYCGAGKGSLLMFRDSFTNALLPFLSEEFENAEYTRILPCRLNALEKGIYDTVILELAERNIPELIKSSPVMEAPERKNVSAEETEAQIFSAEAGEYLHIYGTLENYSNEIYIKASDGTSDTYYEAFPILESELLESEKTDLKENMYGFSAYIPIAEAESNINILTGGQK